MVIVSRRSIYSEIFTLYSCVIDISNVIVANLVSVFEKNMNSIIMFKKLSYFEGKRINFIFSFIDPVILVNNKIR